MATTTNDIDRRILRQLQADPDMPLADLADRCRLPQTTLVRRLDRLRDVGILQGKRAIIKWEALGYTLEVSLRIILDKTNPRAFDEFLEAARKVPEVVEIQTFLGSVDVRLALVARDLAHYQEIYRGQILNLPHMADVDALMQVSRQKDTETLPI